MNDRSIGHKIRVLRQNKKFTQEKLAEKSGMSQQHISKIEQGIVEPTYETIYKMAEALDVSVDTLIENRFKKIEDGIVYELLRKLDFLSIDDIKQLLGYADCLLAQHRKYKEVISK